MSTLCFCSLPSKYPCPHCPQRTCSLPHFNKHKQQCTPPPTKPLKRSEYHDAHMRKDLHYLTELARIRDNVQRRTGWTATQTICTADTNDTSVKRMKTTLETEEEKIKQTFQKSIDGDVNRQIAFFRRIRPRISILALPAYMERARRNKTKYHNKSKEMMWTIEVQKIQFQPISTTANRGDDASNSPRGVAKNTTSSKIPVGNLPAEANATEVCVNPIGATIDEDVMEEGEIASTHSSHDAEEAEQIPSLGILSSAYYESASEPPEVASNLGSAVPKSYPVQCGTAEYVPASNNDVNNNHPIMVPAAPPIAEQATPGLPPITSFGACNIIATYTLDNCSESTTISQLLVKLKIDRSNLDIYLKKTREAANSPAFYKLKFDDTIADSLQDKEIVEFPTFYLINKMTGGVNIIQ